MLTKYHLRGSFECLQSISSEVLTSAYKVSAQRFLPVLTVPSIISEVLTSSLEVESHFLSSLSGLGILEDSLSPEGVLRPESPSLPEAAPEGRGHIST